MKIRDDQFDVRGPVDGSIPAETAQLVAALLLSIVDEQDAEREGERDEV